MLEFIRIQIFQKEKSDLDPRYKWLESAALHNINGYPPTPKKKKSFDTAAVHTSGVLSMRIFSCSRAAFSCPECELPIPMYIGLALSIGRLKGQCHDNGMEFYHISCCFRPLTVTVDRELVLYF